MLRKGARISMKLVVRSVPDSIIINKAIYAFELCILQSAILHVSQSTF